MFSYKCCCCYCCRSCSCCCINVFIVNVVDVTLVALNVVEVNVNAVADVVVCPSNVVVAGVVDVPAFSNVFEVKHLESLAKESLLKGKDQYS